MASEQPQKTIPLRIFVDRENNKVVVVESTKDFVDTLFSFLSLPLATIIRLLTTNNEQQQQQSNNDEESSPSSSSFLGNIKNLYESVQNLTPNDVWNPVCKQMLLNPKNPCESLCTKLFLNIDDTDMSSKFFVCDSCNKFTTFQNLDCTCGKPINRQPKNLDSEGQGSGGSVHASNGVFVKENGSLFLVFDDLKIVPSSMVTSMQLLTELGYSDLTQLEEVTHNIGKQEILNLLKYTLTSHEPLTNTILKSSSKNKDKSPNQFASAVRVKACTSDIKMDVKLVRSKSQKKIIFAEASENFVDFMFSFLTIPLGSVVKVLDGNSFVGCVDNLYKSVENLDSSRCTDSRSVLLNPGVAPQFGCPNQPLNIPHVQTPATTYYYGTGTLKEERDNCYSSVYYNTIVVPVVEGVISKTTGSVSNAKALTAMDPRSPNKSIKDVMGFVKRPALYGVGDDLQVKSLSANSCLAYLKEFSFPLDDLEVKAISIGEAEALSILAASLTSKSTLTSGLEDFFNVPKQDSKLTSKYIQTSRLDELAKEPKPEN
ncbi:uncharacterized protein LOC123924712 isoform X1 [Trifolium pratense]|uniref:uncharacterized protein LOC123924712 isoform X1 n=1 Tax=Trifolium pratense TaxID=57577 RepID=UPI001E691C9C|nr:uncharacterized protein LOC123924712 isoform X1 [Trifolium pratense]